MKWAPYAYATLIVGGAFLFKLMTPFEIQAEIPFLIFFSAVMICGIRFGFRVAIYASVLAASISFYFFLPHEWHQTFKLFLFLTDCLTISVLCGKLKKTIGQAQLAKENTAQALELRENFFRLPNFLLVVANESGYFTELNKAWLDLLGHSLRDFTDHPWLDFVHPDDREMTLNEARKLSQGATTVQFVNRYRTRDGDYKWLTWSVIPVGKIFYAAARDITDLKIAERELIIAKESAEGANAAKTLFLTNMSHEIRTPLGIISGFAELARDPQNSEEQRIKSIDTIIRSSQHLSQLVDEILDLAKIEANKLDVVRANFDFRLFLQEILDWVRAHTAEKGIGCEFQIAGDLPREISTDATKLRQILINLIGNAIKFTEKGSVSLQVTLEDSGLLNFTVRDTGIGISPANQLRLFQVFTQADGSITRQFGGTGLGLALSKKLAELLEGELFLRESHLGQGSAFTLKLRAPAGPTARPPELPEASSAEALRGARILLVDDSADNRYLLRLILEAAGAKIDDAKNGLEGVQLALREDYDLVLMDIQMPQLDGIEATKRLRGRSFAKPIVALSAHAFKGERERAMAQGFNDYLTKPIHRKELIRVLGSYIKGATTAAGTRGDPDPG